MGRAQSDTDIFKTGGKATASICPPPEQGAQSETSKKRRGSFVNTPSAKPKKGRVGAFSHSVGEKSKSSRRKRACARTFCSAVTSRGEEQLRRHTIDWRLPVGEIKGKKE